ncbi:MAG TPA: hypothetical protein VK184_05565 [Nostocaceae cyanobacterium]|nr:hypothetical protein [Nostocaceae cyanobacterium]
MVNKKLILVVIIALGISTCVAATTTPAKIVKSSVVPSTCNSLEKPMISDEITIKENTVGTIFNHRVGVSGIWEWELPDDNGVIAPRMSARLSIWEIDSEQVHHEDVFAGKEISIGSDRYCVVDVEYMPSSFGSVTLRKIQSDTTTK